MQKSEQLLGICLTRADRKELFPSGGNEVTMLRPQGSATMMATSWGEMTQENEDDTIRHRYSRQRERETAPGPGSSCS